MSIRADFYMIAGKPQFIEQPLLLVCQLAAKVLASNQTCLILCETHEQAEFLDDLLWEFDDDAFIPHQIFSAEDDESFDDTPILIIPPGVETGMRGLVINLRNHMPPSGYQRVLEIVPALEAARQPARQRWAEYKKLGVDVSKHDL